MTLLCGTLVRQENSIKTGGCGTEQGRTLGPSLCELSGY